MSVHSMVILELRSVDCRDRRQNDRRRVQGGTEGEGEGCREEGEGEGGGGDF